jgi:hypothetical protein
VALEPPKDIRQGLTTDDDPYFTANCKYRKSIPYLQFQISGKTGKKHNVIALYDSGCTTSLISTELLEELQRFDTFLLSPSMTYP